MLTGKQWAGFCLTLISLGCANALPGVADELKGGCAEKEAAILKQLDIARAYNNTGRVQGLETALENVRAYCTQDGLKAKAEMNVVEKSHKVWEREEELAEAIADKKDEKKLAKRRKKLEEAKNELAEAERERDALK